MRERRGVPGQVERRERLRGRTRRTDYDEAEHYYVRYLREELSRFRVRRRLRRGPRRLARGRGFVAASVLCLGALCVAPRGAAARALICVWLCVVGLISARARDFIEVGARRGL